MNEDNGVDGIVEGVTAVAARFSAKSNDGECDSAANFSSLVCSYALSFFKDAGGLVYRNSTSSLLSLKSTICC